jgi:hypothetical protein
MSEEELEERQRGYFRRPAIEDWCRYAKAQLRWFALLPLRWIWAVAYVTADFRDLNVLSHFQLRMIFTIECLAFTEFPIFIKCLPRVIVYQLIQQIIGPMIYWPLRIFQRPICWVIQQLRGGV